ncbi:MAG: FeoB-associated Cys-rich membrane protein [Turicibacter sp.]|nr:FeoB-associated Cys-rich membrane protein [Turicibacter sp.]
MENLIVIVILLVIIGCAIAKIAKEKRSGAKCIGCPHTKNGCHCPSKPTKKP